MDVETAIERFIVDEIMLGDSNTKIDPNESLISSGVLELAGFVAADRLFGGTNGRDGR